MKHVHLKTGAVVRTSLIALVVVLLIASGIGAANGLGKYKDPARAVADGYAPTDHCVPNMGYHYANIALFDETVKVSQPEVLVYVEVDGERELAAAEYLATEPFRLFGQESEPGPFPGSYALHVWFFLDNPDGRYTDTNPNVGVDCTA